MASKPGILTDWPWKPLGNFKYVVLAPLVADSIYSFIVKDEEEKDLGNLLIFPFLLFRMLHNQIWISLSRHRTAKGDNRILDRTIEFDQVDRERSWDDQLIFSTLLIYAGNLMLDSGKRVPFWRTDGVIITILLHAGAVEFLYYWLHRALHHHYLYSRYHSHHHSSIVTEPITSVVHPFAEHIAYHALFAVPVLTCLLTRTSSIVMIVGYLSFIDFMNNMGHCNFEIIPNWVFTIFPPLKYLMYTPSFHSLHHTQFRTNYSLFMPLYDYIYGTTDNSSEKLYETALGRRAESPDVVHLTHLTTPDSIYHLRLGFASLAAAPSTSRWFCRWLLWPFTAWSMMITWIYGRTFVVERNLLKSVHLQTWAIPKYAIQYFMKWQKESINGLIEDAILEAEEKGIKVVSLGLLNQSEDLNRNGELYIRKNPKLRVKIVDGSSLAVAAVLNSIPKGSTQVVLRGILSKVAYSIALALCQRGIQVVTVADSEYKCLKAWLHTRGQDNLVLSNSYSYKVWLVGDGLRQTEQEKASKGTIFIPFSQFPPKKIRKDCIYHHTPAMLTPKNLENLDSCENWLPRRAMSAWRIAGIVHALEGWEENECGKSVLDIDKVWQASLNHGFHPLIISTTGPNSQNGFIHS